MEILTLMANPRIMTSGRELQGQERVACVCVFRSIRLLQVVVYTDGNSKNAVAYKGFWGFRKPFLTAEQFLYQPASVRITLLILLYLAREYKYNIVPSTIFYACWSLTVSLIITHSSNITQLHFNQNIFIINCGF